MREKIIILTVIVLLFIGTFYFHIMEDWSYTDSFYFSTITLTTIGYGDLYPSRDSSKIFVSIYALVGISIVLYALGSIIGRHVIQQGENFHKMFSGIYDLRYNIKDRSKRRLNRELGKDLIKRKTKKYIPKW